MFVRKGKNYFTAMWRQPLISGAVGNETQFDISISLPNTVQLLKCIRQALSQKPHILRFCQLVKQAAVHETQAATS